MSTPTPSGPGTATENDGSTQTGDGIDSAIPSADTEATEDDDDE